MVMKLTFMWSFIIESSVINDHIKNPMQMFDDVGCAGGDRLCGESRDIWGDRFVIEIRGDYSWIYEKQTSDHSKREL